MLSELEQRPRLVTIGYGEHGSQWVKLPLLEVWYLTLIICLRKMSAGNGLCCIAGHVLSNLWFVSTYYFGGTFIMSFCTQKI